jgi:hypothetical protein
MLDLKSQRHGGEYAPLQQLSLKSGKIVENDFASMAQDAAGNAFR